MNYWVKTPILIQRIFGQLIWSLPKNKSQVYLTFDDGPTGNVTEDLLNILSRYKVKATFSDLTTIYAKINVPLGGTYLKIGMSQVDVESVETMNSGNSYGNDSTTGMTVGLGYNHDISNGISIRAEVTASEFDDVTANNGVASTGNRNVVKVSDMIGGRGTISIVKAF